MPVEVKPGDRIRKTIKCPYCEIGRMRISKERVLTARDATKVIRLNDNQKTTHKSKHIKPLPNSRR